MNQFLTAVNCFLVVQYLLLRNENNIQPTHPQDNVLMKKQIEAIFATKVLLISFQWRE